MMSEQLGSVAQARWRMEWGRVRQGRKLTLSAAAAGARYAFV